MSQSVGQVALDIVVGKNEVSGENGVLSKLGGVAKGVGKTVGAGLAAAGAGIVAIGKQAVSSYAEYEQLVGGVETLFKDMADTVIENADNAYKTAGMSANEYMQTVTGFAASLLQSTSQVADETAQAELESATERFANLDKIYDEEIQAVKARYTEEINAIKYNTELSKEERANATAALKAQQS